MAAPPPPIFERSNLIAWCIVPFDSMKRSPEDRAAMLERLGFKHFAYDWRAEHESTFDREVKALKARGVALDAWWVAPGELNRESRLILDVLKRNGVKATLWVLLDAGPDKATGAEQERRVAAMVAKLGPLAEAAKAAGCSIALYNHGGWFGEPENQVALVKQLKATGHQNVGIVYNLHHGHDHVGRLADVIKLLKPYLVTLNLNGMDPDGDKVGRKILPLGQGSLDLDVLKTIVASGYNGPIGILGHTMDDAEARLKDNLDGLDWLVPQLHGPTDRPKPTPRTPVPPRPKQTTHFDPSRPEAAAALLADAKSHGDAKRGAEVFASATTGCLTCHKVGPQGGTLGPDLSTLGTCMTDEAIVASILWPKRDVKPGYAATAFALRDGRVLQGYRTAENPREITLREATTGATVRLPRSDIEDAHDVGSLMPEGLLAAMTAEQRRDLLRFLLDLDGRSVAMVGHAHAPAEFPYERKPLDPAASPSWEAFVNRDRVYDYYAKEAEFFAGRSPMPPLLPPYPGMDGGKYGHWGNQNEQTWVDARWNDADLGNVMAGVFRGAGVTVPKGVCVRLGDKGEMSACYDPQTNSYPAIWQSGFVKTSDVRHGFMDGLILDGKPLHSQKGTGGWVPAKAKYRGYYRHGARVIFSYEMAGEEWLDSAWVESGKFTRTFGPAKMPPLSQLTKGGPLRWGPPIETKGTLGKGRPYAVDTIELPFKNAWNVPLFVGGHDFMPDGTAYICTIQGDVWRVDGLDETLAHPRWKRFASGLHQALGLVIGKGGICILGRDQITQLHDLNNDGEADFYECISNAYETSPAGHDFICGLERDQDGSFYTVSGKQGLLKILPGAPMVDVIATGFRNPDGLGLSSDGVLTVPCSEGEWTPSSMICEVRRGGHYGYTGPGTSGMPDLPLVYLPRGLDNSSGGQATVTSDRWGPLKGQLLHFSFGTGNHFLILRDKVDGQPQGAVVPLPGEFRSGVHRGRFNPKDGQLYVSGSTGWGSYTTDDGSFQRVRYTGDPVQLPVAIHAHQNGILIKFSLPIDASVAGVASNQFAQAWNYRYGPGYGSPEMSSVHAGAVGHDPVAIRSATVLDDGRSLFLEMPEIQPVNQLHMHVKVDSGRPHDLFATVHRLSSAFTGIPGYSPRTAPISPHPIVADLAFAANTTPNPWKAKIKGERSITIEAGKNLTFSPTSFTVKRGEPIRLTFLNPDVVPHNWALVRPGKLAVVGDLANRLVADPDAVYRQYIPKSADVIVHTDVVAPLDQFAISFVAPSEPGHYPYLCTFPGHWMVMNGVMVVQ